LTVATLECLFFHSISRDAHVYVSIQTAKQSLNTIAKLKDGIYFKKKGPLSWKEW